jgi:hypothetical protein
MKLGDDRETGEIVWYRRKVEYVNEKLVANS